MEVDEEGEDAEDGENFGWLARRPNGPGEC